MNSAQIGATATPPVNPKSRLSSKPTKITVTRLEVLPANQPSREVPVFPAAGNANPLARTVAPVPLFKTSFNRLVTKNATRGSSTAWVSGVVFSKAVPLALTTSRTNRGARPFIHNVLQQTRDQERHARVKHGVGLRRGLFQGRAVGADHLTHESRLGANAALTKRGVTRGYINWRHFVSA